MANTLSSTLVVDVLKDVTITTLQNRLAGLNAFCSDFGADRQKPRSTVQVAKATAGSTTLTNPASYESGDSTLDPISVTVNELSQPFHITAQQRMQGFRMEQLLKINLRKLANAIWDIPSALMTTGNFGAKVVDVAAASFDVGELKTIWAAIEDAGDKNVVLSGDLYSQFLPSNLESFNPVTGEGGIHGFDRFLHSSRWSAAGTNVEGFAGDPQAIGCASGLPDYGSDNDRDFKMIEVIEIPDLGLSVEYREWFSRSTRSDWGSFGLMFGAAVGDATAGKVIGNLQDELREAQQATYESLAECYPATVTIAGTAYQGSAILSEYEAPGELGGWVPKQRAVVRIPKEELPDRPAVGQTLTIAGNAYRLRDVRGFQPADAFWTLTGHRDP